MKRRRIIWTTLILVTLMITAVSWVRLPAPDPLFHGRPESDWISGIRYGDEMQEERWREFGPEGVQVLIRGLEKTERPWDRRYRRFYRKIPQSIRRVFPSPKMDVTRPQRMSLVQLIARLDPDPLVAAPIMTKMLEDEDPSVRQLALTFFSRTESPDAPINQLGQETKTKLLPLFLEAAQSPHVGLRNNAIVVLRLYPETATALPPIIKAALHDKDPNIRNLAAKHLRTTNPDFIVQAGGIEAAITALNNPNPDSAFNAARLLGETRKKPDVVIPALLQAIKGTNHVIAEEALRSVGRFPENASTTVAALNQILLDPAAHHRDAIGHMIEKLTPPP